MSYNELNYITAQSAFSFHVIMAKCFRFLLQTASIVSILITLLAAGPPQSEGGYSASETTIKNYNPQLLTGEVSPTFFTLTEPRLRQSFQMTAMAASRLTGWCREMGLRNSRMYCLTVCRTVNGYSTNMMGQNIAPFYELQSL